MNVQMGTADATDRQQGNYGTSDLEDLARRYTALEEIIVGKNWPDDDMDRLIEVSANLQNRIREHHCSDYQGVRGKLRYLLVRMSCEDHDLADVADDLQQLADEVDEMWRADRKAVLRAA